MHFVLMVEAKGFVSTKRHQFNNTIIRVAYYGSFAIW